MATSQKCNLRSFRAEVLTLIEPHTSSADTKPPFTISQLTVISLAMTSDSDDPQSAHVVMKWMLKNFQYYASMAHEQFCRPWRTLPRTRDFHEAFKSVLDKYDVPLVEWTRLPCAKDCPKAGVHGDATGLRPAISRCKGETLCSLDIASARIFLGLHADGANEKPFRLLDLPTELREKIFEMALILPGGAVVIAKSHDGVLRPFGFTRDFDHSVGMAEWDLDFPPHRYYDYYPPDPDAPKATPHNCMLQGPPLGQHLALLSTNKKIHNEALPIFYRNHTFVFQQRDGFTNFLAFMRHTSMKSLNHIRHIAMMESKTWITNPGTSIQLLKYMGRLRELDLYINEEAWDLPAAGKKGRQTRLLHTPCIQVLRSIRGLSRVTLHGPCPILKLMLETEMCLPRPEVKEKRHRGRR